MDGRFLPLFYLGLSLLIQDKCQEVLCFLLMLSARRGSYNFSFKAFWPTQDHKLYTNCAIGNRSHNLGPYSTKWPSRKTGSNQQNLDCIACGHQYLKGVTWELPHLGQWRWIESHDAFITSLNFGILVSNVHHISTIAHGTAMVIILGYVYSPIFLLRHNTNKLLRVTRHEILPAKDWSRYKILPLVLFAKFMVYLNQMIHDGYELQALVEYSN